MSIVERKTEITELNENIKNLTKVVKEGSERIAASILALATKDKYNRYYPMEDYSSYIKILGTKEDDK